MTWLSARTAVFLGLPFAAVTACGGGSGSSPAATGTSPSSASSDSSTSAPPTTGPLASYSSQGSTYTVRAVTPVGTTAQITSPYLTATDSAPAGQQIATVTIEVTNTLKDRPEPLAIATVGDIDFSFAVPSKDSAGLPDQWQGDCNVSPAPTTASHGFCVDVATRVQSTTPSLVDQAEPQIPPGDTVTMRLYSSAFPKSLALDKLQLIYIEPFDGTQTHIPLTR
jgi:hypothetical protein